MTGKNKYFKRLKISEAEISSDCSPLCAGFDHHRTHRAHGRILRSVNDLRIRRRISQRRLERSPLTGAFEAAESHFGARRARGKRGRGAYGKTSVFACTGTATMG